MRAIMLDVRRIQLIFKYLRYTDNINQHKMHYFYVFFAYSNV
jgi:hypothetical protein